MRRVACSGSCCVCPPCVAHELKHRLRNMCYDRPILLHCSKLDAANTVTPSASMAACATFLTQPRRLDTAPRRRRRPSAVRVPQLAGRDAGVRGQRAGAPGGVVHLLGRRVGRVPGPEHRGADVLCRGRRGGALQRGAGSAAGAHPAAGGRAPGAAVQGPLRRQAMRLRRRCAPGAGAAAAAARSGLTDRCWLAAAAAALQDVSPTTALCRSTDGGWQLATRAARPPWCHMAELAGISDNASGSRQGRAGPSRARTCGAPHRAPAAQAAQAKGTSTPFFVPFVRTHVVLGVLRSSVGLWGRETRVAGGYAFGSSYPSSLFVYLGRATLQCAVSTTRLIISERQPASSNTLGESRRGAR